jgi:ribosomal 50S subunit-recycling heat shock protein
MKYFITLSLFILCSFHALAYDHWLILVNGQRVFECIATCSAGGLNTDILKASVKLKPGDKVTVVYTKDSIEAKVTKNIMVSDSALKEFQTFSVYDAEGDHAVTVKADDFNAVHKIVIWYSEKKMVNNKEVVTQKIPLVYFE